jgi:hypothetical protein
MALPSETALILATPAGFEPAAFGLEKSGPNLPELAYMRNKPLKSTH